MIPEFYKLKSLNVYRDGGSLSITYKDKTEHQYKLMFSVDRIASNKTQSKRIYRSASIISYIESEYLSPVTGISCPKIDKKESEIPWHEAAKLLKVIEPHIDGFTSEYLWVFNSMVTIATNENHSLEYSRQSY